ncbi:MAG: DNA polymerase III subunit alpha [Candidatus Saelkia tenebricola]|nr:DNA polymerase III subunit alpha [Candidatus Saelkia tenebricola]
MKHSDFVHLHLHSQYSLLDGACKIDKFIELANDYRMPAVAITDHGNLFGAIDFYLKAMQGGIKPIIGCEVYLTSSSRFEKSGGVKGKNINHLTLLAKNEAGYKNLIKLVSLGYLEGFYYKPRVDRDILAEYGKDLICLSGCMNSALSKFILDEEYTKAEDWLFCYKEIFDKDCFYVEIQDQFLPEQRKLVKESVSLAEKLNIPYVATNDVHYLRREHSYAHEVLLAVQTQTTVDDPGRLRFSSDQFYFKSPDEMKEVFKEFPEAIKNTIKIAEKCNVELEFNKVNLPQFKSPDGYNPREYLGHLCNQNLEKKYPASDHNIKKRLDYELDVINRLGFTSYFLIVRDFVNFAKKNSIPVGPGRGSAAGSIVSFLLGITSIDPLKYGLLFERFLNPDRVSMPDIDIDFCYERRQEVIDYVIKKYGESNVAQVITFGTLQARAAIRDVARALNIPYQDADRIAKLIPQEPDINIAKAITIEPALSQMMRTNTKVKQLLEIAQILEGLCRHVSIHAAGVVISDKPLIESIALYKVPEGEIITGFDMASIAKVGLMKMDFLGLRTLTMIDECQKIIKGTKNVDINVDNMTSDDLKTYQFLSRGDSTGVFQLESEGMRSLLTRLKPEKFEDLIAILALYRPGPLGSGMVDDFIKRRSGAGAIEYEHILLEPILKETYGIILYQEQAMQIASDLAGFTMAEADLLRRAMGKKLPEAMSEQEEKFIQGAKSYNVSERKAGKIFGLIQKFAGYGFNKSHSAAYAMISYNTAYLKAHFFPEFITALLSSEMHNADKLKDYLRYAVKKKITILGPDVNESYARFTLVNENTIRFGLSAVKNVGIHAIESIIAVRREKGRFESIFDFCKRVNSRAVNKKVIESLIKTGSFDSLGYKRSSLMAVLDRALDIAQCFQKDAAGGQLSFFNTDETFKIDNENLIPDIDEWPQEDLLKFERNYLGFYISGHPLDKHQELIQRLSTVNTKNILQLSEGKDVIIGGLISSLKKKVTRGDNQQMAIIKLEDLESSITAVAFSEVYEKKSSLILEGNIVFLKGKFMTRGDQPQIIVADVVKIEDALFKLTSSAFIELSDVDELDDKLKSLNQIVCRYKGDIPLMIVYNEQRGKVVLESGQKIEPKEGLLREVKDRLGLNLIFK